MLSISLSLSLPSPSIPPVLWLRCWWIYGVAAAGANAFDIYPANEWVSGLMLMYARVRMPINEANCIFVLLNILLVRGIRVFLLLCSAFFFFFFFFTWSCGWSVCMSWLIQHIIFSWQIKNNIYFGSRFELNKYCFSRAVAADLSAFLNGAFGARKSMGTVRGNDRIDVKSIDSTKFRNGSDVYSRPEIAEWKWKKIFKHWRNEWEKG